MKNTIALEYLTEKLDELIKLQFTPIVTIDPPEDFSTDTELLQWHEAGHVVSYSDGLIEAFNREGEDFSAKMAPAFSTTLTSPEDDRMKIVVDQLKKHMDGEPANDEL